MSTSQIPTRSAWRAPALLLGLLGGCAHTSSFQDADTVPAGKHEVGVAVVSSGANVSDEDRPRLDIVEYWPAIMGWGRIGVARRVEIHGMVWPLGGTVGAKYQLVGYGEETGPAVSLGLDMGVSAAPPSFDLCLFGGCDEEDQGDATSSLDLIVPVYLGYKLTRDVGAYVHPKYLFRRVGGIDIAEHYAGGSAGFTLGPVPGKLNRFYVEGTAMSELHGRELIFGVGFGLGGRLGR